MNDAWDKKASQCAIYRQMLQDVDERSKKILFAVCGDEALGVHGLVGDMKQVKARLLPLEKAQTSGVTLGRAAAIVGSFIVGLFVVAGGIIALVEFIKGK